MTTPTATALAVDVTAIERDIAALLAAHGLGHHGIQVSVAEIVQAGQTAGVSITGMAYTPPPGVPTQRPDRDLLGEIAEDVEVAAS